MKINRLHCYSFLLGLLFLGWSNDLLGQFYNGTQTDFGKNRVQYDAFEWQFYRFDKFETYFYTGGKSLAEYTSKYVNRRLPQLEKHLDYYNRERLQFIIYNKQSHFRQSNIGLVSTETYNIGGVTNIVGTKVFIYFEGDYAKLNQQIDAGIYQVLIYQMIYGGNWREVLRNSALLHLPSWYISGLVSYLSNENDHLINAQLKDGILNEQFKKFNSLDPEESLIAGHAMWAYLANTYGDNVISNILYMTHNSRNVDDGFLYVLGISFEDLYNNWLKYYQTKYAKSPSTVHIEQGEELPVKVKKGHRYEQLKISPNADKLIFSTNKLGKYKIFLQDLNTNKKTKIFKAEHQLDRIQDYSYPIVNWHPSGKLFSFIIEQKGGLFLYTYNLEDELLSSKAIFKLEKILSYDYSNSGKQFVFSGVNKGQSDIYLYNILGNTQKKLTDDSFDDLNPIFSNDGNSIIFSSNRDNDSLHLDDPINEYSSEKDLFLLKYKSDPIEISAITDTDEHDELHAFRKDEQLIYSIQKSKGPSLYSSRYDSSVSFIDTSIHYNYYYNNIEIGALEQNALKLDLSSGSELSSISFKDGKYLLQKQDTSFRLGKEIKQSNKATEEINLNLDQSSQLLQKELTKVPKKQIEYELDIYNYSFSGSKEQILSSVDSTKPKKEDLLLAPLKFPTQRLYRLNFRPDNSVVQLNNAFINGQYQLFNGGPFTNPGLGVNTKIGIVDLMEDHRVYGSFRFSGDVSEYGLSYQNLKKRLDKEYSINRRKERSSNGFFPYDLKTLQANFSVKWPFSEVTSIRGTAQIRNDKFVPLSGDQFSLILPTSDEYWASLKAAYVYDNTRNVSLNIRYGTRFKVYAEQYQLAYSDNDQTASSDLTVFGLDFRHYQKIHKEIISVSRFAGSASRGSNPIVYYLGGVDEWWKSDQFDENTPIDQNQNYGFQALAANMRGFLQNVRNGNNFAVINQEIRVPIFSYLINRPIQSDFVRNFQLIGFGDLGTAWIGDSPFAKDNPINNETRRTGPITVTYENINDPLVAGFGFGLRTTLLGYFMRADWGWGVENGVVSEKPLFIFSLSLDI